MKRCENGFLKDDGGMTLTELTAAMAVASVLMMFVTLIYTFTGNVFTKTAAEDDLARTTQAVMNYLEDRISCAQMLEISRERRPDREDCFVIEFSEDGRIYCGGEPVYHEEFYQNRKVFCQILPAQAASGEKAAWAFKYRITWKGAENTALYSADSVIKLLNLELAGDAVIRSDQDTEGNALYFYYTEPDYSHEQ